MFDRDEAARKATWAAECVRNYQYQTDQGRNSNKYFEIIFGFRLTSFWWKSSVKRKMLLKKCEGFYTQNKVQWKIGHETSSKRLLPTAPHGVLEPRWRCKVNDTQRRGHMLVTAEMTCEMCWTWCRCQRWGGPSTPADSLRWLEKHFGGCYTLLFYPSAVSVCSLSLHTIKQTSLAQAPWAWHRKWSSVRDPLLTLPHRPHPHPHPHYPLWMKLFCAVHQRRALLFIQAFFFSVFTYCICSPQVPPRSVAVTSYVFS